MQITTSGANLQIGDTLPSAWFRRGEPAQIKSLRPYVGTLLPLLGEGTQIAAFYGTTLEMTIEGNQQYTVERP